MKITTTETHHRSHHIHLSQQEVENLIRKAICEQQNLSRKALFIFDWAPDTVDSGLRKVPQINVRITEDLCPQPEPAEVRTT